jgi:hypothetical protein
LEQGIEIDPRFALAHARLSSLHAEAYEYALDRSEERLRRAGEAADRALEIDPDLPEGHLALGYNHYAVRDYESAGGSLDDRRRNDSPLTGIIGLRMDDQGPDRVLEIWALARPWGPIESELGCDGARSALAAAPVLGLPESRPGLRSLHPLNHALLPGELGRRAEDPVLLNPVPGVTLHGGIDVVTP